MYQYDEYDQQLVDERVAQYRDQTRRYLAGDIGEEEFRPLRLMNGLYIQRKAPMLRVAIPYGLLSSKQVRKMASIARDYDRGYGHISTRQNIQYNWPELEKVPDILAELASVQMHAIQTSGNCIRNVTADPLAGVAGDEIEDPRPYCEIIRQWSTFHPEFTYLPRKFKIAVSGAEHDRAAVKLHDVGLYLRRNEDGEVGFCVMVGGGQGRMPHIAKTIRPWIAKADILSYLEAVLRVYNLNGRRDNKHRARIKILVNAMGVDAFRAAVDAEWEQIRETGLKLTQAEIDRVKAQFSAPAYKTDLSDGDLQQQLANSAEFTRWYRHNTEAHKMPGYQVVFLSLKAPGVAPGDVTDKQMDAIADLADEFNFGEAQTTHWQNFVLKDVQINRLHELWLKLKELGLATANIGTLTDMICCPGGDFCSLANATSIDIADQITQQFDDLDYLYDIGELFINISGCMNACGHHHVGHIGILGVDKKGQDWYQITLGGDATNDAKIGDRLGRSLAKEEVAPTINKLVEVYINTRHADERFIDTYQRIGLAPFQERIYG